MGSIESDNVHDPVDRIDVSFNCESLLAYRIILFSCLTISLLFSSLYDCRLLDVNSLLILFLTRLLSPRCLILDIAVP